MKKYTIFLFALFLFTVNINLTLASNCAPGDLFHSQTGKPCPVTQNKAKKDLTLGSRGEEVKKLQQTLKDAGFLTGKVDGIYGPITKKAAENYEANNQLSLDTPSSVYTPEVTPGTSSVTVLTPNGGESWQIGSTKNITWQDTNNISTHEVKLVHVPTCEGDICYPPRTIANTQGFSYSWVVGNVWNNVGNGGTTTAPSGNYKVEVCQTGTSVCDSSNATFSIFSASPIPLNPPSITSISPTSGTVNTNVTIKGKNFTPNNTVQFGSYALNAVSSDGFTTSFVVPVGTALGGHKVSITNTNGVSDTLSFNVIAPPSISTYQLVVLNSGTGNGKVTSSPSGISCTPVCTGTYNSGTAVTITAMPSAGSDFTRWEGACTGIENACTVTMTSAKNATAIFTPTPATPPTPEPSACLGGATSCVKVTSLSPSSGGVGTVVKITGTGFTDTNSVTIGKTTIPNLNSTNNYTNISFTVPNITAGSYDLTVTSGKGTSMPVTFTVMAAGSYKVLGAEKFYFSKFLELGMEGDEVTELQKFLNSAGYNVGNLDGKFGAKTESALVQFEIANGLAGDGKVGPLVRALLNK